MATGLAYTDIEGLAVLLMDMQYYYVDTREKKNLIPNQIAVIEFCADKNIPVVVIKFAGCGPIVKRLKDAVKKLPQENVLWVKKYYINGFHYTHLHEKLQAKNIRTLILMGVNAGLCVHVAGMSAIRLGYKIITSSDLIADYNGSSVSPEWYIQNGIYVSKHTDIIGK